MSKPQPKKNSGTPAIIIVLVLVVAVIIAAIYYNSSRTRTGPQANATPSATRTPVSMANAPLGAQPPNFLGAPNAAVTVEEFADFQCPSCGSIHPVMKQIQGIFGQRIKFIFRHFPLPIHDKAYDASAAAEAAGLQGKFWDMYNLLFTNQQQWSNDPNYRQVFRGYAEKIGLDVDRFETDMAGLQTRNRVQADIDRGKALSINSTPSIFINGKPVPYPEMNVATMQRLIEEELKSAQTPQSAPAANGPTTNTAR